MTSVEVNLRDSYPLIIGDGEAKLVGDTQMMDVVSPASGEVVAEVPLASRELVDKAVKTAAKAQNSWGALSMAERGKYLKDFADALRDNVENLARIDAFDSGNSLPYMRNDLMYGADSLDYFAGIARELHGKTLPASADGLHMTLREPFGVVARILPFNHPLMFTVYHVAAPLIAGNTVVVKAPDQTPISPLEVAYLAAEIFPPGVLTVLTGNGETTGDALVCHPLVRRIGFTGRKKTGLRVMERAAQSGVLKNVSVELGGKNPLMVFPDADPAYVANQAVMGMNFESSQGQSCGSTSRLFVHEDLHDQVVEALVQRLSTIKVGDPLDSETTMGPVVDQAQKDRVLHYIEKGKDEGATLVCGGGEASNVPEGGFYIEPTLFDDVETDQLIAQEEIFGPVLSVLRWRSKEELLQKANATPMGLTANIITRKIDWAISAARQIEAGCVWINGRGQHYLETPFGGYKDSGLGSEGSMESLQSYTRIKALHILDLAETSQHGSIDEL
ncbi:MAG: aldehyde dehydrogenase family protein [Acidimicrobiales bacterium]|nr:aldehyde dehydrogenase family protein [Actinomycetota bacterium]MDG1846584.1 aldehyde dehydrogenase family protein [Acidimicrobiales bacterium]